MSGSSNYHYEEAADLFIEASNLYRLRKDLELAGDTFLKAANCQMKAGNEDEAGNTFIESFKCYKTGHLPQKACNSLENAIDIFTRRGQLRRGANFKFELAEIQELELQDYTHAISNYQIAGDWYEQDQAIALSNKAYLKCADLKALDNQFIEACDVYLKVVKNSLGNRLSQWSLKDYYLKIGLCYLAAGDIVAAKKIVHEGQKDDSNFSQSRESELLSALIDAVNDGESDKFSNQVFEFDKFSKLDKWKTMILLKIKESIIQADEDLL